MQQKVKTTFVFSINLLQINLLQNIKTFSSLEAQVCPSLSDKDQTLVNQLSEYFTGITKVEIFKLRIVN